MNKYAWTSFVVGLVISFAFLAFADSGGSGNSKKDEPSELDRQNNIVTFHSKIQSGVKMTIHFPARIPPGSALPVEIVFTSDDGTARFKDTFRPYTDNSLMISKSGKDESVPLTRFGHEVFNPGSFSGSSTVTLLEPGKKLSCRLNAARLFDLSFTGKYTLTVRRHISLKIDGSYHNQDISVGPVPFVVGLSSQDQLEQRLTTDDARRATSNAIKSTELKNMTPDEQRIVKEYYETWRKNKKKGRESN